MTHDAGAWVRLRGCDDATLQAFHQAPSMFRHPDNPKLQHVLVRDYHGVHCTLITPPAYRPTEALLAELNAAAAEAGVKVWVSTLIVTGPIGAISWQAAGVPSLWIGEVDPEPPPPDRASLGYRPRFFGAGGTSAAPPRDAMVRALLAARDRGFMGVKPPRRSGSSAMATKSACARCSGTCWKGL